MTLESSPIVQAPGASLGRPRKQRGKRTLASLLRERGVLSTNHAVEVALAICDALGTAHANGVIHGQLGLGYVRLRFTAEAGPTGVEIFTLAPEPDDSGASAGLANEMTFLEPERDAARPAADVRSDVWALGALLHTMLLGVVPPPGDIEVAGENIPRSLGAVVESCLAIDPSNRPESVDDIAERIASFAKWPPDHFARLAARREARLAAERVRENLERRGLSDMPNVLDKLDGAAVARAQREDRPVITSVLLGPSTEAAMERLMSAVHEGTDAARVELASALPALVDFDDDDDDLAPNVIADADEVSEPVPSPLAVATVPLDAAVLTSPLPAPVTLPVPLRAPVPGAPRSRFGVVAIAAVAVIASCVSAGSLGYVLSARVSTAATPMTATESATAVAPASSASAPEIPVFAPSALPEAPITPESLPEAKR